MPFAGNVAFRKAASQSSLYVPGLAERAVDGNTQTRFWDGSCAHTKKENSPWRRVDLGIENKVKGVAIWNRGDCCGKRLSGFQISVGMFGMDV